MFLFSLFLGGSYGSVTRDKSCGLEASLTQLARKQRTRGVLKASTVGLVVAPDVSSGEPLRVSATGLTISPNLSSGALQKVSASRFNFAPDRSPPERSTTADTLQAREYTSLTLF